MTGTGGPRTLGDLVASVASILMPVDSGSMPEACEQVLRQLVGYLGVDSSFLRRNDHEKGVSVLLAEWPRRENVPDPDPLGVVPFVGSDPIFAASRTLREPLVVRPGSAESYRVRVEQGSGLAAATVVGIPLLSEQETTGALGLVKRGDRSFSVDELNALAAIATLLAQVTRRAAAEDRIRYHAHHDELTGLANRRAITELLERRLAAPVTDPVGVLFVDLDRFKAVNDFLGYSAGDEYLTGVARRLEAGLEPGDVVARLSGDEFVIVPGRSTDDEAAGKLAIGVLEFANEPVPVSGQEIIRTVSVGVATGRPGQVSVSELLSMAGQAALSAKASGGNDVTIFTGQMRAQLGIRNDIELHLRAAIDDDALTLQFQPEVDLRSGRLLGAEALVRWRHPSRGLLPPDSFIGVAEVANLTGRLGRWVLDAACTELARWLQDDPLDGFVLRVNVSPAQIISVDFADVVAATLARSRLDGSRICLELTEHAVVRDVDAALITLRALRELGVQTAIDDFGTGYSSLAQLKALPVDCLKIDRGFVQDLGTDSNDMAIVASIVGLATAFGLDLVAEGVQSALAARTLVELGCYRAQGYLFGRPMDSDDLRTLIRVGAVDLGELGL